MASKQVDTVGQRTVVKAALKVLSLSSLNTDSSYQRDVKGKHKKIVAEFNEEALGIPLIGEREDGTLWIVDGLQRITALRKMGKKEVRCEVFASNGPNHEAEVFKLVNMNRTRLTPSEEFRALLTAGDKLAWGIKEAVEAEGFTVRLIGKSNQGGTTSEADERAARQLTCINTLVGIARHNGTDPIRFTLRTIARAWPGDRNGPHNIIVGGLAAYFIRRDGIVDEERLVPRLQLTTPQKIMYATVQSSVGGGGSRDDACADVIEKINRKRVGKRQ